MILSLRNFKNAPLLVPILMSTFIGFSKPQLARGSDEQNEASGFSLGVHWAGRYIFSNTFALQAEWEPLTWLKPYVGLGVPYSRIGILSALGTKLGFNWGPVFPHLLLGATASLYKTRSVTDHVGMGVDVWFFQNWGIGAEVTTSIRAGVANTGMHFGGTLARRF